MLCMSLGDVSIYSSQSTQTWQVWVGCTCLAHFASMYSDALSEETGKDGGHKKSEGAAAGGGVPLEAGLSGLKPRKFHTNQGKLVTPRHHPGPWFPSTTHANLTRTATKKHKL